MHHPSLWTQADEELLLELERKHELLQLPALRLLFNAQASQERTLGALEGKLGKLHAKEQKRGQLKRSAKEEAGPAGGNEDRAASPARESDTISEASTLSSTQGRYSHQPEQKNRHSHATTHPSRRSTTRGPGTPPASQAHHRTSSQPPKAPTNKAKRPREDAEDGAVTELQAIRTQRSLVQQTAKLAEMEQAFLRKHQNAATR